MPGDRRWLIRRASEPVARAAETLFSDHESEPTPKKQKRYHKWLGIARRTFVGGAVVAAGAYALEATTGIVSTLYKDFLERFIVQRVEGPIAQSLTDQFLNKVPKAEDLLKDFPEGVLNREIEVSPEQRKSVHWYVFGDSMNLNHGKKTRGAEDNPLGQVGSYPYEMTQRVNTVNGWDWKGFNFAVPGAESGKGIRKDGTIDERGQRDDLLGERQLGNQQVRNALIEDPSIVNVVLSLNGNDWREIVPSKEKVATYLDWIQHPEDLSQAKIAEIKGLIDRHNETQNSFGKNIREALEILTDINKKRIKEKRPKLEITFVLPINNRVVEHVPFQPIDAPTTRSGGYFIGNTENPNEPSNLQKVLYHLTMSIIGETADAIDDHNSRYKKEEALSFHAISKFGLEETEKYIDADGDSEGHLNENGQFEVGNRLFHIVRDQATGLTMDQEPGIILDYPGRLLSPRLRRLPN